MRRRQFLALFALGFLGVLSLLPLLTVCRGLRLSGRPSLRARCWSVSDTLPAVRAMVPFTPVVVTRTVLLNAIAGVAFGWLFWRRSLEAAMIADATGHVVPSS
jgi:hypothetical protein